MTPIQLFPSDATHKKSMIIGAIVLFVTFPQASFSGDQNGALFALLSLFGFYMFAQVGWAKLHPKPSFEADADGFSVMGKPKRPWDEFRAAKVQTSYMWFIPVSRTVTITTGKSILGGRVYIRGTHLSAPAKEMAAEIATYAREAKFMQSSEAVMAAVVPEAAETPRALGVRPAAGAPVVARTPKPVTSGSPVETVPSFGERIFGRRKVL